MADLAYCRLREVMTSTHFQPKNGVSEMKNCEIDWNEAPEWCVAHGLKGTVMGIKEFWLGDEMYQSLDQQKAFLYGGVGDSGSSHFYNNSRNSFSYVKPRPAAWNGEGLPPVGTVCGMHLRQGTDSEVEVLAYHGKQVWLRDPGKRHYFTSEIDNERAQFFVVRTPDQIAAEERERAVREVYQTCNGQGRSVLEMLGEAYDAGLKKAKP